MIMILRDSISFDVDGIIISETADPSDIQDMIEEITEEWRNDDSPDDLLSRIEENLPDSCHLVNEWNTLWY